MTPSGILSTPFTPLQSAHALVPPPSLPDDCLPCGFFPFGVFPASGSHSPSKLPTFGVRCPLSVSHTLRALLHPMPAGLVSCRCRPWGSPSRALLPTRSRCPSRDPIPSCGLRPNWPSVPVDSGGSYPGGCAAPTDVALQVEQRRFPGALLQGLAPRVSPYTLQSGLDSTGHRRLSWDFLLRVSHSPL